MTIKTGVIGISSGNGHPYSWSAIINGYNEHEMLNCRFNSLAKSKTVSLVTPSNTP